MRSISVLALALALAAPASAQCGDALVEGFDDFSNLGAWGWNTTFQASLATGGNPAWQVRSQLFASDLPAFGTQDSGSVFAGDWRARGVTSAGIDLRAYTLDPAQCGRPVALRLASDAGTPADPLDDRAVLRVSSTPIPCKDASWHSHAIDVPAQSAALPAGWTVELTGGLPPARVWDAVIQDVTQVQWLWGDPALPYPTTTWQLAADNARLAFHDGPTTYCVAQPSGLGCSASLVWQGAPSASQPLTFLVQAVQVAPQASGLFFYGYAPAQVPLLGGTRCVAPPIRRTALQVSTGAAPCSGTFAADFNVLIQSGTDPLLVAGATAYTQVWSRDAAGPTGSSLTNALRFTICP